VASIIRQLCKIFALVLPLGLAPCAHAAESLQLVEQEIKAGLLYNFLKYTDWPQPGTPGAPMSVCLMGGDPFSGRLQPMSGRTVNQHVIEVRSVAAIDGIADCSILFIHAEAKPQWPALHMAIIAKPVLTVSDIPGFSDSGGMIEFTHMDNRIGMTINSAALRAAHLQVQERLLKLANALRGGAAGR
jgi:hypothetical protein